MRINNKWNRSSAFSPTELAMFSSLYTFCLENGLRKLEPSLVGLPQEEQEKLILSLGSAINAEIAQVVASWIRFIEDRDLIYRDRDRGVLMQEVAQKVSLLIAA